MTSLCKLVIFGAVAVTVSTIEAAVDNADQYIDIETNEAAARAQRSKQTAAATMVRSATRRGLGDARCTTSPHSSAACRLAVNRFNRVAKTH